MCPGKYSLPGAKGDCCHPRQGALRYGYIPDVSTLLAMETPEPTQLPPGIINYTLLLEEQKFSILTILINYAEQSLIYLT